MTRNCDIETTRGDAQSAQNEHSTHWTDQTPGQNIQKLNSAGETTAQKLAHEHGGSKNTVRMRDTSGKYELITERQFMFSLKKEQTLEPLLLSRRQAAKVLSISERTLWTLTANGEIQAVRFGRSVRYDPADLRQWIETKKTSQNTLDLVNPAT
jgi:excisionase family DNA binding protein